MNRFFFFGLLIPAAALAACGGKVLVDGLPPSGAGGAGAGGAAATGSSSHQTTSAIVGGAASTGSGPTSTASGASCDPNYGCAQAITPPNGDPKLLCPGSMSAILYQALLKCICGGPCAAACAASTCLGQDATPNCIMCVQNPATGCGNEYKACANDI